MPGSDIWCWTGYLLAELSPAQRELVALLDVLVDGKFEKELADPGLLWRGSSNQMVHDLNAWREGGSGSPSGLQLRPGMFMVSPSESRDIFHEEP